MPPKAGGIPLDMGGAALETASLCPTGCPTLHSTLHFPKAAHAYHFVDSQASEITSVEARILPFQVRKGAHSRSAKSLGRGWHLIQGQVLLGTACGDHLESSSRPSVSAWHVAELVLLEMQRGRSRDLAGWLNRTQTKSSRPESPL